MGLSPSTAMPSIGYTVSNSISNTDSDFTLHLPDDCLPAIFYFLSSEHQNHYHLNIPHQSNPRFNLPPAPVKFRDVAQKASRNALGHNNGKTNSREKWWHMEHNNEIPRLYLASLKYSHSRVITSERVSDRDMVDMAMKP
ncbi:F-box protein [Sesbania bispinosa]|nr:F-box protein [Sesbania bispinosa]